MSGEQVDQSIKPQSRADKIIDWVWLGLIGVTWLSSLLTLIFGGPVSAFTYFMTATALVVAAVGWTLSDRRHRR